MKLDELFRFINEYGPYISTVGRPDGSGIRGKGVVRKQVSRLDSFPYDRDVSYGQPTNYDRGNSITGPLNHILTPKDDSHFSLSLLASDDEIDEVMGSPILFTRATSSHLGSPIPGNKGWAGNPMKPWDESDLEEAPLSVNPAPNHDEEILPGFFDPEVRNYVGDLEARLALCGGDDDDIEPPKKKNPDAHIIGPDVYGTINHRISSRGLGGLMPKESAWDKLKKF